MEKGRFDYLLEIFELLLKERPELSAREALQATEESFERFKLILDPEQS